MSISRRPRASSRASRAIDVEFDDGYSYALRVAFLNYQLQPKKKRKEYVPVPKPVRSHTASSSVTDLMKEFMPSSSSSSSSAANSKLPHGFRGALEKRMEGVLRGVEKLPGYNDAAVKRTFGEAYTAFTDDKFRKNIDKDRKIEPLILIFYTSASKAQMRGKLAGDDSWKPLIDRHVALFVRLVSNLIREMGSDQNRPEFMNRLATLEKKLLTNDQDLGSLDASASEHKTIEVEIPLTYDVKDMPMVQTVARIFGRTTAEVQTDIDRDLTTWTPEAALHDLKIYQHQLTMNMPGALRRGDFDLDTAYDEWKKTEIHQLTQLMLDLLTVHPELAKSSTASGEKGQPFRPTSMYMMDETYADISRMISAHADPTAAASLVGSIGDGSLGFSGLSMKDGETSSIRTVEEAPEYMFIPPNPRAYYKFVLKQALTHDKQHPEDGVPVSEAVPIHRQTMDFLIEVAAHWRLPQFARHVILLDVAAQKYIDLDLQAEETYEVFEDVKDKASFDHLPQNKKQPYIQLFGQHLSSIERSQWTSHDYAEYQQILVKIQDAMLRELLEVASQCYEPKPRSIGPTLLFIQDHIHADTSFPQRQEVIDQFSEALKVTLADRADGVYRGFLDKNIPREEEDWNFSHVVELGKDVVAICERTKKRYRKNPEIMGVSPYNELVAKVFPSFEADAQAIIERIIQKSKERGLEVNMQDGFDLYKELTEIRKIHVQCLPGKEFAFHIENLLEEFVWRWIKGAQERMEEIAENSIKQDQFQPRVHDKSAIPTDDERHSVSIMDLFQAFNQAVDQIYQLHWDNDVHHAKFMTSLSGAFTAGLGRYCEIVEQRFAREMDRPTAQELASSTQTTQEKWMQYARDAMSNKEKIEPFQFYPESFVKLNNIEFAMQALDKLETAINVDACAEVLAKANGPIKPVDRRNAKYVFTIKIVEAEDLKACDPTGTSDPYVVLGDEYQKRLAKTRIIMRNLNPRWDESVEITVSGPLNIIATIWDYDTFGAHDFVGRTSLKLDPLHFSDYLPREFWLDLDTQGRLLLRVSMEGERDDIQFQFGKAFRHLKRTERDMVRKVTDKLVAHINASLSYESLKTLLNRGSRLPQSVTALWQKSTSARPLALTQAEIENTLQPLFTYFNDNFAIMKETLTHATMMAVMTRLWKEVLMAIENLLVPPLSEKPSTQKSLTQAELDIVYKWLEMLFDFFNARGEDGEVLGVPADILKSPKYHELASLNFFYFETTENLVRISERMAAATAQRAQQQLQHQQQQLHSSSAQVRHMSAPAGFGPSVASAFASMGTIRRGKSIMMSRNLGTLRQAKAEKRKEAQADPSDDMILRILRMRPEAVMYLKERHRQKERMAAHQAAALIVKQSINQGWNNGPAFGGAAYNRNNLPAR